MPTSNQPDRIPAANPADVIVARFLDGCRTEALALAAESDLLTVHPGPGPRPRKFVAEYRCRGLVERPDGAIAEASLFRVGVFFPDVYLQGPVNPFEILTWLGPEPAWHPNIADHGPFVCIGPIRPGTTLVELLFRVHAVLCWHEYAADDVLNDRAAQWARRQPADRFPVDPRPLKWREPAPSPEVAP